MTIKQITHKVINLEWHYIRQKKQGSITAGARLNRCQRIIERMELKGWLP